jgi:diacylglycerol kinase (CTP)
VARPPFFLLADSLIPGFMTLYLYASHGSPERVVIMLSSAMLIIVPADILRLNFPPFERTYERVLGFLMRESEKVRQYRTHCATPHLFRTKHLLTSSLRFGPQKHTNGVIWYIIGVVFVLSLYPLDIAVLSILM